MLAFLAAQGLGMAIGFVAGAFTPSILRGIKALWVKDTTEAKNAVEGEVKKVVSKL